MKFAAPLCLTAILALLSGCSSMKVSSKQTADFNFSSVKTFEWVQAPKKILDEDDTLLNESVQRALNNALSERGWKQVLETANADIQVVYYIKLAEHEEYTGPTDRDATRVTGGFTYKKSNESWGYTDQEPDLNVYTIAIGTLELLLYDAESGRMIWTGTLQTRLDRSTPLNQQQEMLRKIAAKITHKIPAE
ncbi:DUF4136 domain-containing protein [Pontiellaceae bacterium B12227]|nr:DUF4136 domain-containing protein [Pontiellaceae bacterium B12227]